MDKLPVEIIEKILCHSVITIQDVISFSATCRYFRDAVMGSFVIWKQKYHDNWPQFTGYLHKSTNFLNEIQYVYDVKRRIIALLELMPARHYKKYQLTDTDFVEWTQLTEETPLTYNYVVLVLTEIINTHEPIKSIEEVPLNTPGNLTLQYYASKALRFVKQQHLTNAWIDFKRLPAKKQTLEKGAVFVAQWCQTDLDITEEQIGSELDFIAELVKKRLVDINPLHQLLKTPELELEVLRRENIDRHLWGVEECRQIIRSMGEVMYTELGFSGNQDSYYKPENSLINMVLERRTGLPIILAIIYASVGRRLGVLFEPINFPVHFLLRYMEAGKHPTVYYIDTFNGGNIMQRTACPYRASPPQKSVFPVATPIQVVQRTVNNLELSTRQYINPNGRVTFLRAVLELLILVSPRDISAFISLERLYTLHKISTRSLERYLQNHTIDGINLEDIRQSSSSIDLDVELDFENGNSAVERTENLRYAVGMIVRDIPNGDNCVIYGWNLGCSTGSGFPRASEYSVTNYSVKSKQPFYNVLVEDGTYRSIPQDLLVATTDPGALHLNKDVGRHFSHFFENHFVPNAEKEKEYPYDKKIRHKFYHEKQLRHYKP